MVRTTLSSNPTGKWIKSNQDPRTSTPKINKTMKIKVTALSNSTPKEWILLPTIVITSQRPFYIILSWLRWYIEFDFFQTHKSKIMNNISKELFDKFLKLQRSGIMNMTDIERGAKLIKCTEDQYETIIWNYTDLKNKFYPKSR